MVSNETRNKDEKDLVPSEQGSLSQAKKINTGGKIGSHL